MLRVISAVPGLSIRKARLLSGSLALAAAAAALIAFPGVAHADTQYSGILRNWETGNCLDSNDGGGAYTLGCNGGNYQNWSNVQVETMTDNLGRLIGGFNIVDIQTTIDRGARMCLDSNFDGNVYTLPCNGGDYQIWWQLQIDSIHYVYVDKATGYVLTDDGSLHTVEYFNPWGAPGSGQWRPGF